MCYLPAFLQGKQHRLCAVYLHIKHLPCFLIAASLFFVFASKPLPSAPVASFISSLILRHNICSLKSYFCCCYRLKKPCLFFGIMFLMLSKFQLSGTMSQRNVEIIPASISLNVSYRLMNVTNRITSRKQLLVVPEGSFCVGFASHSCDCMGSLRVLPSPKARQVVSQSTCVVTCLEQIKEGGGG